MQINFNLPAPWKTQLFQINQLNNLIYLVGPNGSGKSRFASSLREALPNCRLLSADRLSGFAIHTGYDKLLGSSPLEKGFDKSDFASYKNSSKQYGLGIDAFIILEEKVDVRIRVEATLSQLLNRQVRLEWDSGRLTPRIYNSTIETIYDLQKGESHGIKELLILLTHLYDDSFTNLIIDEPELNLHPQYQSFLIQEVRNVLKTKSNFKKDHIILITHSPFILDIQTASDLKSIISFNSQFDPPSHISNWDENEINKLSTIVSKLNVHHKQLFFSDSPVFVEGIFDAQLIKAIQNKRGNSIEGAGSCIIDVGGNSQIANYFLLSESFNKKSYFIYDLDSLFTFKLRKSVSSSSVITNYLNKIGISDSFEKACEQLESELKPVIEQLNNENNEGDLCKLTHYIKSIFKKSDNETWKKARIALLIQIAQYPNSLNNIISENKITLIRAKLNIIIESLKQNRVYLLPGGSIEHYTPAYDGNPYVITDEIKKGNVDKELQLLDSLPYESNLEDRYGYLYSVLEDLPSTKNIDYSLPIISLISDLIYKIQKGFLNKQIKSLDAISAYLGNEWQSALRVLKLEYLNIKENSFEGKITIFDKWGIGEKSIIFSETTNPNSIKI